MKNSTIWAWVIVIVVIIIGIIYLVRMPVNTTTSTTSYDTTQNRDQGRVVFSVTDAAVNMTNISDITMDVSSVAVHDNTDGWMTVSTTPQTFNLLTLNNKKQTQVLSDTNLNTGTYDAVRLMVDGVSVKTKAGATKSATLPSSELDINTSLVVNKDQVASVKFDVLADKSLLTATNGAYIFAPVVSTESRSDSSVDVNTADNTVGITGGNTEDMNTSGMDIDGTIKNDFQIDSSQKLNIDTDNIIHTSSNTGTSASASTSTSSGALNVNTGGNGVLNY